MATGTTKTNAPGVYRRGATFTYVLQIASDPATGRRRQRWVGGFPTVTAARAAKIAAAARLAEGSSIAPSRMTLATFIEERWLPTQTTRVRAGTMELYRINWGRVRPHLGAHRLGDLDSSGLQRLYRELLDHGGRGGARLGARSVQLVHSFLHRSLRDAVRWGLLQRNPADLVDRPSAPRPALRVWTPAETRVFLELTAADRLAPLWRLFAMTGLRRGEALGLRWIDVDLERQRLSVQQSLIVVGNRLVIAEPKTGRARRTVDLDEETVRQLARWRRRLETEQGDGPVAERGLVFVDQAGRPLHPARVTRTFARLIRSAELPAITVHGLRHSHATALLASGVSPKIAQERLGHFSVSLTLDTYSHALPGMQLSAARAVADMIDPRRE